MNSSSVPSIRFLVLLLSVLYLFAQGTNSLFAQNQKRTHITILSTTDVHGNILPIDYFGNKPDSRGLAKAATIIEQARLKDPNLLLLDSGDVIQGTPLVYYHNRKDNDPKDPMMIVMNALHYDAMAVGNHEYNFGLKVLEKARHEARFPWLSANTYDIGTDHPHFTPYLIKVINGVRVGILGLTTPGIPVWENTANYKGLEFRDPLKEAAKWVRFLRTTEHVDLVILAMHMGLEADLKTGVVNPGQAPNENEAIAIAKSVPGIDVILMGHTHKEIPSLMINGVLLTQADKWARSVARVDIDLARDPDNRMRVTSKVSTTVPVDDSLKPDSDIVKMVAPYERETEAWLGKVIGESSTELNAKDARFRDSAILDLIQRVQLEEGKADVSMAAVFNTQARIPKGPVTVRDIAGLYEYENTLVTLELTGAQLKAALEQAAHYFGPYIRDKPVEDLVDQKIPGYNFDIAEGVSYELDVSKPIGQRIVNLRFKGQPVSDSQKLRVVTNNYRVNGGGGYTMFQNAPVVYRSSEEVRDLIIDWVERNRKIPSEPDNNWRLLPESLNR